MSHNCVYMCQQNIVINMLINIIITVECEDAIDIKPNEVYGITSKSVTTDDIKTIPNEMYGVVSGDHRGVSSCQRWL